jgi:hypothetical protein
MSGSIQTGTFVAAPLPFPPKRNSWKGLTRDQLLADLKVAFENIEGFTASLLPGEYIGKVPNSQTTIGPRAKQADDVHYMLAGINTALTQLYRADHGQVKAPTIQENLLAAGVPTSDLHSNR